MTTNDLLSNVKLNYPSARAWMWTYCVYLGEWKSTTDDTVYDMGARKNEDGTWSAACVYGDKPGSYISGNLKHFDSEVYQEVRKRLEVLGLAVSWEQAKQSALDKYSEILKETRYEREEIVKPDYWETREAVHKLSQMDNKDGLYPNEIDDLGRKV